MNFQICTRILILNNKSKNYTLFRLTTNELHASVLVNEAIAQNQVEISKHFLDKFCRKTCHLFKAF